MPSPASTASSSPAAASSHASTGAGSIGRVDSVPPLAQLTRVDGPEVSVASRQTDLREGQWDLHQCLRELAHDIRGPLAGATESIRLVRDGAIGPVTEAQRQFLSGAVDQCRVIGYLADEFAELSAEGSAGTFAVRHWEDASRIVDSVRLSTESLLRTRGVELRVDVGFNSPQQTFVHHGSIVRLLTNLIHNAASASSEGQTVGLRAEMQRGGDEILWSVMDQGSGIRPQDWQRMKQRGVSMSGSSGLGLSISRRLASGLQTPLGIHSRFGVGTTMSVTTPASGATSVAASFARWRLFIRGPKTKPRPRQTATEAADEAATKAASATPVLETLSTELGPEWQRPQTDNRVLIGTMSVGAMVPKESLQALPQVLQRVATEFELLYPTDQRNYLYALDARPAGFDERVDEIVRSVDRRLPGVRLHWSPPQTAMVAEHRWITQMTDLAVRMSLRGRRGESLRDPDSFADAGQSQETSQVAAARLDAEIRRLGVHMRRQTQAMRAQASKLKGPADGN